MPDCSKHACNGVAHDCHCKRLDNHRRVLPFLTGATGTWYIQTRQSGYFAPCPDICQTLNQIVSHVASQIALSTCESDMDSLCCVFCDGQRGRRADGQIEAGKGLLHLTVAGLQFSV
jgi:hypothetical protein